MLSPQVRKVCKDAEGSIREAGRELHAAHGTPGDGLVIEDGLGGPKVEVTAAQQRQLGQVVLSPRGYTRHRARHSKRGTTTRRVPDIFATPTPDGLGGPKWK